MACSIHRVCRIAISHLLESPFPPGEPPSFEVRDPGPSDGVAVWHLPQLYLHMLCAGRRCSSVLFLSCSATRGCVISRLHRDDSLMHTMLTFVARFATKYGGGKSAPEIDYFWDEPGYQPLLLAFRSAAATDVEVVARIPNSKMQRGAPAAFFL